MKLQNFNAWGMVTVEAKHITVTLSALSSEDNLLTRTIKTETDRALPAQGSEIIALAISQNGYIINSNRLSKNEMLQPGQAETLADHPEVAKFLDEIVNWIRVSI